MAAFRWPDVKHDLALAKEVAKYFPEKPQKSGTKKPKYSAELCLLMINVTSSNVFSGRYSLLSNQNTGMSKQQRGYLFYTNAVTPHKTSQQARTWLVTTLDLRHSCINTASARYPRNLTVTLQQTSTTSVDTYKASKLYTRPSSHFSKHY